MQNKYIIIVLMFTLLCNPLFAQRLCNYGEFNISEQSIIGIDPSRSYKHYSFEDNKLIFEVEVDSMGHYTKYWDYNELPAAHDDCDVNAVYNNVYKNDKLSSRKIIDSSSIRFGLGVDISNEHYSYNHKAQLAKIESHLDTRYFEYVDDRLQSITTERKKVSFEYNSNGKVEKLSICYVQHSCIDGHHIPKVYDCGIGQIFTFKYNSNGTLDIVSFYGEYYRPNHYIKYEYLNGKISKVLYYDDQELSAIDKYHYLENYTIVYEMGTNLKLSEYTIFTNQ